MFFELKGKHLLPLKAQVVGEDENWKAKFEKKIVEVLHLQKEAKELKIAFKNGEIQSEGELHVW